MLCLLFFVCPIFNLKFKYKINFLTFVEQLMTFYITAVFLLKSKAISGAGQEFRLYQCHQKFFKHYGGSLAVVFKRIYGKALVPPYIRTLTFYLR